MRKITCISVAMYLLAIMVFFLFFALFIVCLVLNKVGVSFLFLFMDVVWYPASIFIIQRTIYKMRFNAIPEQKTSAKLILKTVLRTAVFTGKVIIPTTRLCVAFEFSDRTRKDFTVPHEIYNTVLENESGVLVYKEQGKYRYFVKFTPDQQY